MNQPRNNIISLVVGRRGTGKTDLIKNEIVIPSPLKKKLIVDTFENPAWRNLKTFLRPEMESASIPLLQIDQLQYWNNGLYRIFSSDTEELFEEIERTCFNTLLVFEDATKYIGGRLSPSMRKFLLDSKQKNLDVVLVFHSLASIPPELVRIADFITLFKTGDGQLDKSKYPFPDLELIRGHLATTTNHYENVTINLN